MKVLLAFKHREALCVTFGSIKMNRDWLMYKDVISALVDRIIVYKMHFPVFLYL